MRPRPGNDAKFFPSGALAGISDLIGNLGGDPAAIFHGAGISLEVLNLPDIPVPARAVIHLFEQAADACACRNFGLRLASRSNLSMLGPLWALLGSASTVRQVFEDMARHYEIFTRAASVVLVPSGNGLLLCWDPAVQVAERATQAAEFVLALGCDELRRHCPRGWNPPGVKFRHTAPADLALHRKVFGPHLSFDQDCNAVYADAATLEVPMNRHDEQTHAQVLSLMRQRGADEPLVAERVEHIVRALLPYGPCPVEHVGATLGLSARTLQNRLIAEGTTFKNIKDAVRADLALKYLHNSTLSLSEIAEILGYSELSAFSRSFRRWHGISAQSVRHESAKV